MHSVWCWWKYSHKYFVQLYRAKQGVHLLYSPGRACTQLGLTWAQVGECTSAIWARLESEVLHHCDSKHVICLLYIQAKALCSWQQKMYGGMQAMLSPVTNPSWARLTCVLDPGTASVHKLSYTQPRLSSEMSSRSEKRSIYISMKKTGEGTRT